MSETPDELWVDDNAGPVVRPYAMTRGRTRHGAHRRRHARRSQLGDQAGARGVVPHAAGEGDRRAQPGQVDGDVRAGPATAAADGRRPVRPGRRRA